MTPGLLSWLTDIMRARYGHHFVVQKDENSISLHVPGASGRIVIEQFNPGFFRTSSDIPFTKWHAEDEGWRSVLGSPLPAPGASLMAAPLIELRDVNHVIHYDIL